jgi:predicted RNA-binding protein with RPS1 domain
LDDAPSACVAHVNSSIDEEEEGKKSLSIRPEQRQEIEAKKTTTMGMKESGLMRLINQMSTHTHTHKRNLKKK